MRERNFVPKLNVLTSGSPVANLALIIQCLSRYILCLQFYVPVRCFRVLPRLRIPQIEDHCSTELDGPQDRSGHYEEDT
jgi:hypothetical protein